VSLALQQTVGTIHRHQSPTGGTRGIHMKTYLLKGYWLVMIGLALSLLLCSWGSWELGQAHGSHWQMWISNLLMNVSAGIIIIAIVAGLIRWFNVPEREESAVAHALGVWTAYPEWISNCPDGDFFREVFTAATEVELMGVTLHNTIVHHDWFEKELERRLSAKKKTRFLFLDPNGQEISRREKEGSGRELLERALKTRGIIHRGLDLAQINDNERTNIVRHFDFTPAVNWLRFGDTAYVVLLMYAKGGLSPALKLDSKGLLFQKYQIQFEDIWKAKDQVQANKESKPEL
jgi:hypothetical protein